VGAKGCLRYTTARDAADYARWDAHDSGGTIDVFDQQRRLFRSIVIEAAELADSGSVLLVLGWVGGFLSLSLLIFF